MKIKHLIYLSIIVQFLAGAVWADSQLDRLTRRSERFGWEAVGRLDIADVGFCTGVLIAPDMVLTAAHCFYDNATGERRDPRDIVFSAGLRDGQAVARVQGRRAVVLDGYRPRGSSQIDQLRNDAALLQLERAIPSADAAPFAIGRRVGRGDKVSVVSYARGREKALSWQRECRILERGSGALAFSCDVDFGSSGAPVFESSSGRARIVSLVSRGARNDDGMIAYGMEIGAPLAELKAAFRAGRGVFPKETAQTRRLLPGQRNTNSGARFVKP